jgi:scyllo-inositol 2-dehydrogenase (NAD+)
MNNKLNIGVIGLGRLGYHHAMNVTKCKGARLLAVADPMQSALDQAKKDFEGVTGHLDYKEFLKDSDVNAFVIATPTKTHFSILIDVLKTGKPIFVEKPITYTVEEAEKVCKIVKENNIFLQVGFMRRFDPGHTAAKTKIASGEIGKAIYIHDCQRDPNGPPIHYVPESGGLFVDMGIHDLDVARWLMGSEISEIYAQGAVLKHEYLRDLNDVDDGQMMLKFENGSIGFIEISRNANDVYDTRTEVIGLDASVFVGTNQLTPCQTIRNGIVSYDQPNWCLGRFEKAYELEMQAFVDSVLNGAPTPVSAYDGMIGLKLAKAATKSHQTKQAVKMTY